MMIAELMRKYTENFKIKLNDYQISQFEAYFKLLTEWNKKMNLTAITDENGVALKHFADSLAVFNYIDIFEGAKVIDVGTGAGFPGVVMKIARPDLKLTLLDSLNKRLIFLDNLCGELNIDADLIHCRAEEGARKKELRESYDFAVSRAVARLNVLCEYCIPYLKNGGKFIALKGPQAEKEVEEAKKAVKLLGAEPAVSHSFLLSDGEGERNIIEITKTKAVPKSFPRQSAKIKNNPL